MDDNFFKLYEQDYNIEVASDQNLQNYQRFSGRFVLDLVRTNAVGGHFPVQFRFDPEGRALSGDIFVLSVSNPGKQNWKLSWRSDAVYVFNPKVKDRPWDIAAICQIRRKTEAGEPMALENALVTVSFSTESDRNLIETFRCAVLPKSGGDQPSNDDFSFEPARLKPNGSAPTNRHFSRFREIDLKLSVDPTVWTQPFFKRVLDDMLGHRDQYSPLMSAIFDAGIYVRGTRLGETELSPVGNVLDITFNTYLRALSEPPPDPFTFTLVLSGESDQGPKDIVPLGRALGMTTQFPLFYARTVAAVFPHEILRSYLKSHPDLDPDTVDIDTLGETHVRAMSFRLKFYILHELGHLLNLPHPWQRSAFELPGLLNEPEARSWTNYGSLYPFGPLNQSVLPQGSDERCLQSARTLDGVFKKHVSFTCAERWHIRHAMFDDIAAGHSSFVRPEMSHIAMKDRNEDRTRFKLDLDLLHMSKGPTTGTRYENGAKENRYEPVSGIATLHLDRWMSTEEDNRHSLQFRFGSGHLFLLVRSEFDNGKTTNRQRVTEFYDLPPLTIGSHPERRSFMVGSRDTERANAEFNVYETVLPLIRPVWLSRALGQPSRITLQAVYCMPDGKTCLYSNQPTIDYQFDEADSQMEPALRAMRNVMGYHDVQLVSQAARYFDDPLEVFKDEVETMTRYLMDPQFEDVKGRLDFTWLAVERAILTGDVGQEGVGQTGPIWDAIHRINRQKMKKRMEYSDIQSARRKLTGLKGF